MTSTDHFIDICALTTNVMGLRKGSLSYKSRKQDLNIARQVAAYIGLKEEGYQAQMETAKNLYDLTRESQSADLYSVTQAGEARGTQAYGQEAAIFAGGLGGTRARRIGGIGREAIETGVESESDKIMRAGKQSKVQYESAIDTSERDIEALALSRSASLIDYEQKVGTLERDFENEFWDFIGFLDENEIRFDD